MTNFMMRIPLVLGLLCVLPFEALAGKLLSGDEIRQSHAGKTFDFVRKQGSETRRGTITYRRDGSATTNVAGAGREAGTWSIRGNVLCTAFADRKDGRVCDRVEQVSARVFRSPRFGFTSTRR